MDLDVIILTKTKGDKSIMSTRRMMLQMKSSEPSHTFHFHLVESGLNVLDMYKDLVANYITPNENFNYNRFINYAIPYLKHDWILISNDDVSYEKNWLTEILKVHNSRPDITSFSPKDPLLYMIYFDYHFINSDLEYYESYLVTEAIMGWSILIKKESFDKIAPFDELFDMYYQDNDYAMMLKKHGIKHALVKNSIAAHLQTASVTQYTKEKVKKMKIDEIKFRTKWNQLK